MAEPMRGWNDTINMSIFKRSLIKCYWIDTMFLYLWIDFYAINGNSRLVICKIVLELKFKEYV